MICNRLMGYHTRTGAFPRTLSVVLKNELHDLRLKFNISFKSYDLILHLNDEVQFWETYSTLCEAPYMVRV
jgi:hypothetical protein